MTKIISQKKIYSIGNSFYVLIPKEIREDAKIDENTSYRISYDTITKIAGINFIKGD